MDVNLITKEILIPYVLMIWVKWTGKIFKKKKIVKKYIYIYIFFYNFFFFLQFF